MITAALLLLLLLIIVITCHEVLHQQISFRVLGESTYSCLDAKLYGSHEGVGLDLLVGDQPILVDPPVADLPVAITVGTVFRVSSAFLILRPSVVEGAMLIL